ncbi:MAG: hypothetical protein NVS3B2_02140 [Ramlibacter sp.]
MVFSLQGHFMLSHLQPSTRLFLLTGLLIPGMVGIGGDGSVASQRVPTGNDAGLPQLRSFTNILLRGSKAPVDPAVLASMPTLASAGEWKES